MKKISLFIIALAVVLTSCFDDPGTDITFDQTFVELDAAGTPNASREFTFLRENDGIAKNSNFRVLLSSAALTNAVNVTVAVDPASTAIEGLHYTLNSASVSIPAGEFSADVDLDILADNIEVGERLNLILEIVSADVEINSALDSANHIVQIACPIPAGAFEGDYSVSGSSNTVFSAGIFGTEGGTVTLNNVTSSLRSFTANYIEDAGFGSFPTIFNIDFVCDEVKIAFIDTGVGCGGNAVNLSVGPGATNGVYDASDDSSFTVVAVDNVESDCGGGPVDVSYTFTKL